MVMFLLVAWCCICETDGWDWQCCFSFHCTRFIRKPFYVNQTEHCFHSLAPIFSIRTKHTVKRSRAFLKKHFRAHGESWAMNLLLSAFGNFLVKFTQAAACTLASLAYARGVCIHLVSALYMTNLNKEQYKMVVHRIVLQKNGETVSFVVPSPIHETYLLQFVQQQAQFENCGANIW